VAKQYTLDAPAGLHPGIDYAAELNSQQLAAVTSPPGLALVIAGAGSGKTRTLTYRVAWLLEQGVPAGAILLLTFTNKAAREMIDRVISLLPRSAEGIWAERSIPLAIILRHAERIGFRLGFTIADRRTRMKWFRHRRARRSAHQRPKIPKRCSPIFSATR
jgi:DNA helicase-2/ATP-dependent DNA helicase PcrA